MKSIREVSVEGKRKKLITQLTGFQSEIVETGIIQTGDLIHQCII